MKLLVDTHVILWLLDDPNLVSVRLLDALSQGPDLVVSAASLWEIAIKRANSKLIVPDDLPMRLAREGFELLPISASHAWAVRSPVQALAHKDPFDRMLHVQASLERLTLATRDAELLASGLEVIEARGAGLGGAEVLRGVAQFRGDQGPRPRRGFA